ncbi:MAG: hypothetical protein ACFE9L_10165 [Candidatus Hodarchaeota archaeon]
MVKKNVSEDLKGGIYTLTPQALDFREEFERHVKFRARMAMVLGSGWKR